MAFLAAVAVLTSCSDENDGKEPAGSKDFSQLATPAMAKEAAKYKITNSSSPYASIELTESGDFVVITQKSPYYAPATDDSTRASGNFRGKFTKIGEGEYLLEGFGSLTVTGTPSGACELILTLLDGTEINLGAQIEESLSSDEATVALCRTWKSETTRMRLSLNGKKISDRTAVGNHIKELPSIVSKDMYDYFKKMGWTDDDDDPSDYGITLGVPADEVIFTKSGSYILITDNTLSTNIWKWSKRSDLEISWSHDVTGLGSESKESGNASLSFNGKQLVIYEKSEPTDEDEFDDDGDASLLFEIWSTLSEKL